MKVKLYLEIERKRGGGQTGVRKVGNILEFNCMLCVCVCACV